MASLDSMPHPPREQEHPVDVARNARAGLWFFGLYVILYGGFMGLTAFAFKRMSDPALAGVNLAIVYGFGLILSALVLAVIYIWVCRNKSKVKS